MERDRLFIEDLAETVSGLRAAPVIGSSPDDVTTRAIGEEGDQVEDGVVTTQSLGEEGDQIEDYDDVDVEDIEDAEDLDDQVLTTDSLGEEGDQPDDPDVADVPIDPDWGTGEPVVTTNSIGEEGDQSEDQPIDVPIDTPFPSVPIDPGPGNGGFDEVEDSCSDDELDEYTGDATDGLDAEIPG